MSDRKNNDMNTQTIVKPGSERYDISKKLFIIGAIILHFLLIASISTLGQDTSELLVLSDKVGEEIDSTEKMQYHLFPYYSPKDFQSAQLFRMSDNSMVLKAMMKNGSIQERSITNEEYRIFKRLVGEGGQIPLSTKKNLPGRKKVTSGVALIVSAPLTVYGGLALSLGSGGDFSTHVGNGMLWVGLLSIPVGIVLLIDGSVKNHRYKRSK